MPSCPALAAASVHCVYSGSAASRQALRCSGVSLTIVWPGSFSILAWPESSSSPQALPTLPAHSLLQWSSMTFFWAAESLSYQPLFIVHANVDA